MDTKIINNGFTPVVQTELFFAIIVKLGLTRVTYSLYMRHGSPAFRDWFRSSVPVKRCETLREAQEWLDTLAGVIDAHKQFPVMDEKCQPLPQPGTVVEAAQA